MGQHPQSDRFPDGAEDFHAGDEHFHRPIARESLRQGVGSGRLILRRTQGREITEVSAVVFYPSASSSAISRAQMGQAPS